jgi:uncharacterized protein YneF (UPF0154 family)
MENSLKIIIMAVFALVGVIGGFIASRMMLGLL